MFFASERECKISVFKTAKSCIQATVQVQVACKPAVPYEHTERVRKLLYHGWFDLVTQFLHDDREIQHEPVTADYVSINLCINTAHIDTA